MSAEGRTARFGLPKGSKTVGLLTLVQCGSYVGQTIIMLVSGLAGALLAPTAALATLPLTFSAAATMPGSLLAAAVMRSLGRRRGFMIGQTLGLAGALTVFAALVNHNFWLMCAGFCLLGVSIPFFSLVRFAAAEVVAPKWRNRAMSIVFAGGIGAALLGPELAIVTEKSVPETLYAGCYLAVASVLALNLFLLVFAKFAPVKAGAEELPDKSDLPPRSLREIGTQAEFVFAVMAGALGYSAMAFLMVATPLSMHHHGFDFADTASVMRAHVLAMFIPSLFVGIMIDRIGPRLVIAAGVLANIACAAVNLMGMDLHHFSFSLILLGLGWNFMFIGGTSLLVTTYRTAEREKAQGLNDTCVFTMMAASTLLSGMVLDAVGWQAMNAAVIVVMAAIGVIGVALSLRAGRRAVQEAESTQNAA